MRTAFALVLVVVALGGCQTLVLAEEPRPLGREPEPAEPRLRAEPLLSDEAVRAAVEQRLVADGATPAGAVRVRVEDGVATLQGDVESVPAKARVALLASSTRGVRGVVDLVEVTPVPRDDEAIASDVREAFEGEPALADAGLMVDVDRGVVTVSGEVRSRGARALVERMSAAVRGVRSVLLDLDVRDPTETRARRSLTPAAQARALLAQDPRLAGGLVDVQLVGSAARLTGTVPTLAARAAAEERLADALGLSSVDNDIEVRPRAPLEDAAVAEQIEAALSRDPWLFDHELTVVVDDGVVTLVGEVGSRYEARRAHGIVSGVEGVLAIEPRFFLARPLDKSDDELRADVLEQMFWNPLVDPEAIDVDVESGIVWLRGEAPDARARAEAREAAFLAGARDVVNELEIPTQPPPRGRSRLDSADAPPLSRDPVEHDAPYRGG